MPGRRHAGTAPVAQQVAPGTTSWHSRNDMPSVGHTNHRLLPQGCSSHSSRGQGIGGSSLSRSADLTFGMTGGLFSNGDEQHRCPSSVRCNDLPLPLSWPSHAANSHPAAIVIEERAQLSLDRRPRRLRFVLTMPRTRLSVQQCRGFPTSSPPQGFVSELREGHRRRGGRRFAQAS